MEEIKKEILDLVTEEIGEEFEVFFTKADNNNGTEREVVSVIPRESAKNSGNHIGMVFAKCIRSVRKNCPPRQNGIWNSRDFRIQTAEEMLANITGEPKEQFPNLIPMHIIHTQYGDNGAAALLFNSLFEKLSREAENDLYVLPSSIDEIIVMPVDQKGMEELRNAVESINSSEVPDDRILSDNVYRYCRRTGQLMIV